MSQIVRKWITDGAVNNEKLDAADVYTVTGILVDSTSAVGKIGIGVTDPLDPLHIKRPDTSAGIMLDLDDSINGRNYQIYSAASGGLNIQDQDTGTDRFTLLSSGRVGISTTNPQDTLHARATTGDSALRLDLDDGFSGRAYQLASDSAGDFLITDLDAATTRLTIDSAGTLTVAGDTTLSGNFQVNGTTTVINTEIVITDQLEINQTDTTQAALIASQDNASATEAMVKFENKGSGPALTVFASGNNSVGIGTTDPNQIASVSSPSTQTLHCYSAAGNARIVCSGATAGMDFVDLNGAADDKWFNLLIDSGLAQFRSLIDAGGLRVGNIITMDMGSGYVGMGTSVPDGSLHVHTASAGSVTANVNGDDLVVENSVSGGISILVPDAASASLYLGSTTDNVRAVFSLNASGLLQVGTSMVGGEVAFNTAISQEAMRIDSNGNVGVGTIVPDGTLHVFSASAGTITPHANADDLVVENSLNGGISVLTPDAAAGSIFFGSPSDNNVGSISVQQSTAKMTLGTQIASGVLALTSGNGVESVTVNSGGEVGIGTIAGGQYIIDSYSTSTVKGHRLRVVNGNDVEYRLNAFPLLQEVHLGTYSAHPLIFNTGNSERMMIGATGNIGIGADADADDKVTIVFAPVNTQSNAQVINFTPNMTGNGTLHHYGQMIDFSPSQTAATTNSGQNMAQFLNSLTESGTNGNLTYLKGQAIQFGQNNGVGTVVNAVGVDITPYHRSGTIGNSYGIRLNSPSTGGTVSNEWAIYVTDDAPSYFAGQVGIGTTDPLSTYNLDVYSSGNAVAMIRAATSPSTATLWVQSGTAFGTIRTDGSQTEVGSFSSMPTHIVAGGSPGIVVVNSSLNVGIGTATPISRLHVYESGLATLYVNGTAGEGVTLRHGSTIAGKIYTDGNEVLIGSEASIPTRLIMGNNAYLSVDTAGQVGIGTLSPALGGNLQVEGSIFGQADNAGILGSGGTANNWGALYMGGPGTFPKVVFDSTAAGIQFEDRFLNEPSIRASHRGLSVHGRYCVFSESFNVGTSSYANFLFKTLLGFAGSFSFTVEIIVESIENGSRFNTGHAKFAGGGSIDWGNTRNPVIDDNLFGHSAEWLYGVTPGIPGGGAIQAVDVGAEKFQIRLYNGSPTNTFSGTVTFKFTSDREIYTAEV